MHSQSYQNIEIIVVDDGSPGTANAELCEQFPKVTYFEIENSGGPAQPRNTGIKEAKGDFLAFTDDDDIWLPEKLEKQVAILNAHQKYGLVHGPCEVINEDGKKTGEIIGKPGSPDVKHGDVKLRMMGNWTLMMPTPLLRRELVEQVGFFSEEIPPGLEDVEYWVRCSFVSNFYYLDEPLVHYRIHSQNISSDKKKYVSLPLFLLDVLRNAKSQGLIDSTGARLLNNNLVRMQLKMLKQHPTQVLMNLRRIEPWWFFKLNNMKLFVKKLFSAN
jgi:glycosyltransferase involved in cell wall biosynthesis